MSEEAVGTMYIKQAQRMEREGDLRLAERLYLIIDEADLAINMYKKARQYDNMVRLVKSHRPDLLKETYLHLAQQQEMEGNLKVRASADVPALLACGIVLPMCSQGAEVYYADGGDWEGAVNMYRGNDLWEDAYRVAKFNGGVTAGNRVAYAWALSVGGEAGSKLLTKLVCTLSARPRCCASLCHFDISCVRFQGLVNEAITYAIETANFEHAFALARSSMKEKLPEVHLKHALFLEDEGRFKEAEAEFIAARKPKEAVEMYVHQEDWTAAMRIAEQYDPASISDILIAQARVAIEVSLLMLRRIASVLSDVVHACALLCQAKDLERAEGLFVDAKKPELALRAYLDARRYPDALRVAKAHLPHKIKDVNAEIQRRVSNEASSKEVHRLLVMACLLGCAELSTHCWMPFRSS